MSEVEEIPEEGELVIATVIETTPHGVYVSLDEYGGMPGFLHISEISSGWVRNVEKYAKVGQKMVLKVIRVNAVRKEVDLSLRQVTEGEKREKLIEVKKLEKAKSIFEIICNRLNLNMEQREELVKKLLEEYDDLYEAFEQIARKGGKALEKLKLPSEWAAMLEQIAKEKITIPIVKVKGIIEATVNTPTGVEVIREALTAAESVKLGGSKVMISYVGAPRYRIVVEAENYKWAEKALEAAIQKARDIMERSKGRLNFIRE